MEPPSLVDKAAGRLIAGRWQDAYTTAIMTAAAHPDTARIFVNPVIKKALCEQSYATDPAEQLRKIRPWWGHDAHFHVRMHCPPGNPDCQAQAPIPSGDGCNADLDNWIADQSDAILHPKPPRPSKPKPLIPIHPRCASLLGS
ncbi:penicillin-insensitive murein endopeptidase [Suttonella sp. R2A3]|uniref:penicillin-insensitive murein endopeptidase n=1 Tax=Suttonella sp. R2A3 TaxID=2908648 RepID=UPI002880BB88|nr:penicillin-insensitive murein endopeptidase [Suttonella sp. R2A3]